MIAHSLLAAGACVLLLGGLSLAPRWAQRVAVGALAGLGVVVLVQGGWLAGPLLVALAAGLHAVLTDIRRANAAALPPSGQAPGAPLGAGEAGKRDDGRAPSVIGSLGQSTARRAAAEQRQESRRGSAATRRRAF